MTTQHLNEGLKTPQPVLDPEHLAAILGSNEAELLIELYQLFLDQIQELQTEISAYSTPPDRRVIEQTAHKYKSSSQSIGAHLLAELLLKIEDTTRHHPEESLDEQLKQLLEICAATESRIRKEIASIETQSGGTV
jgi:HPt (histidine-containing phosphotransfer) domain-containing protein